jgi:D-3-phosphoglycerate dehydrogenase
MKKRTTVLVSAPYLLPALSRFRPIFEAHQVELVVPHVEERLEEAELLDLVAGVEGVICGDDRFTERVLTAATELRVICKWGTGIDSIDQHACQRLGIAIYNTPNAFTVPVSDSVLGYMLSFARKLPWMSEQMKAGTWDKIPGFTLQEATVGIIGYGNVGQAIARKAEAFDMRILVNDVRDIHQAPRPARASVVGLELLLRESDFVSVNCDLNPSSQHLLSDREFLAMKPSAVVINTARGPVVDEAALVRALQAGRIGGAALDVYEQEPLPANSPLRTMQNVLLAPHNSNSSPEAWERVHQNTLKNLFEGLERVPCRSQQS